MSRLTLPLLAAVALATGCYGTGTVGYSGSYNATVTSPDLVYAAPGVQVIADYDEPIFYSDNYYWRYDNGGWYRSSVYTGGWVYASPPRAVISIREPYRYRRYRPAGYVSRNRGSYRQPVVRDHRAPYRQPVVRDHRQPHRPAPVVRDHRPAPVVRDHRPGPVIRDHRPVQDRREDRRDDRRDDRRPGPVIRDHR